MKCIDEEIPFDIPNGWEWSRMSSLSKVIHYGYTASATVKGNAKLLRITDIQNGKVMWGNVPFCSIAEDVIPNYRLDKDDIVIARTGGTVGKSFIIPEVSFDAVFASYLIRIKLVHSLILSYIAVYLESPCYWQQLIDATSGTGQPNVNGQSLSKLLVPIPPVFEQTRIAEFANRIKPIVENYSSSQKQLDKLNEEIKEKLKKSVLQEAIRGELVPQDSTEQPVSSFIEHISNEKLKLLKKGEIKKKDMIDSLIIKGEDNKYYEKVGGKTLDITDEIPFDIPSSWVWVRLSTIANLYTGNSISETEKKARYTGKDGKDYIGTKDVGFDSKVNYKNGIAIPDKYITDFKIAKEGSVLLCIEGGSAGRKVAILDRDVCFGNKLCCFFPFGSYAKYIYYYIQSPSFFEIFQKNKTGIIGGVSVNTLKDLLVAFPPKQEQERICLMIDKTFSAL